MAVTQNEYTGNGSTTDYQFTFEYLKDTDIKVYLNAVETDQWFLASPTIVRFNTAPANGVLIVIKRDTDLDSLPANFFPGSSIRAQDLNTNFTHVLYVAQESEVDNSNSAQDSAEALVKATEAEQKAAQAEVDASSARADASSAQADAASAQADAAQAQTDAAQAQTDAAQAVAAANSAQAINDSFSTTGSPVSSVSNDVPLHTDNGLILPVVNNPATFSARSADEEGSIQYNTATNKLELYDGGWQSAAGGAVVSPTPPVPASNGDVWYDQDSGRAYVYYKDADSTQWVEMNPSWNGGVADGVVTPAKMSTGAPQWLTDGKVGVGTSNPSTKLHVQGSDQNCITLGHESRAGSWRIEHSGVDAENLVFLQDNGTSAEYSYIAGRDNHWFYTAGTQRMRLSATGTLYWASDTTVSSTQPGIQFENLSHSYIKISGGADTAARYRMEFINGNGSVGNITTDGSTTLFNSTSDYRLKENVIPIVDSTTRLKQLKPSRFNYIADPDTVVDGFLAHEAKAVVPECVTGEKDAVDEKGNPVYQAIDQSKLVPLLTAALQEAIEKIESLEARINTLEGN